MKKTIIILCLSIAAVLSAQGQGLQFTDAKDWNAVLREAKATQKCIFIDVYATWCKPCKLMDSEIFPDTRVGDLMNGKFVSIKIQTDRTIDDNDRIKSWYGDATMLSKKFRVLALPTQILLSPNGELLYQHAGYNGADKFISMVKFAIDPKSNDFRQKLAAYKAGQKDYVNLPALIQSVRVLNDQELTHELARDYFANYLNKEHDPVKIIKKENVDVARADADGLDPNDCLIMTIRKMTPKLSDSLSGHESGTSKELIYDAIRNVELEKKLWKDGQAINVNPDFKRLEAIISKKYPDINAKELIYIYQRGYVSTPGFYQRAGNLTMMNNIIGLEINKLLTSNIFDDLNAINNWGWFTYFCNINDISSLQLAVKWMDKAIERSGQYDEMNVGDKANLFDTKAALLYKLGQRQAAITTEQQAIVILQTDNIAKGVDRDRGCRGFFNVIAQMKNGEKIGLPDASYPADWKLKD